MLILVMFFSSFRYAKICTINFRNFMEHGGEDTTFCFEGLPFTNVTVLFLFELSQH